MPQAGCGLGHTPFHENAGAQCPKNFCSQQTSDTKHPSCWCHQKVIHSFSQYLLGPHCVAGLGPAAGHTAVRGRESRFLRVPVSHLCLQEAFPQSASRLTELSVCYCLAFFLRCSRVKKFKGFPMGLRFCQDVQRLYLMGLGPQRPSLTPR